LLHLFHIQLIQKSCFLKSWTKYPLFTATNNYDYVLYISHGICMLLRLLRGHVLHHSIEKKMERKPPKKITLSGQPQIPMENPYEEAHMYMTAKVLTCLHTSSYPIGSRVRYLYFVYFVIKGNDKLCPTSLSYSSQRWTHIRAIFPRNTNWTSLS
jgi:hypothetical protein